MFAEWTIINKTLEAADKTHIRAAVPQAVPRILPPVPKAFPSPPPRPSPSIPAPSRPIIKLKVGSQSQVADASPQSTPIKPRKNKPKNVPPTDPPHVDAPPPPYVDDGSHDILQEVLAMERANVEKRIRTEKDKEKHPVDGGPEKRKKSGSLSEDDILTLATPAKKDKPSPGPSTTVGKVKLIPSAKPGPTSARPKPERVTEPARPTTNDVPRISIKGKEKEIPAPILPLSIPKPKKATQQQGTPINEKKCKDIMKVLQKLPEASIFSRPVDPVLDGCPT